MELSRYVAGYSGPCRLPHRPARWRGRPGRRSDPAGNGYGTVGDLTALQTNAATNPQLDAAATRGRAWRGAGIPAANGTSNARAMATILAVLSCGGVAAGRRLLSEAGCRRALEVQVEGRDLVLDLPLRFGLGFAVANGMMPNPNTLYWGGLGGSLVIVDLDARTTLADVRGLGLAMAMWQAMDLI
jgi:hypothetical protein